MWWITVVKLPAPTSPFLLIWRTRRDLEAASGNTGEELADFKLHMAKNYALQATRKEAEQRLTDHLLRIEHKLDGLVRAQQGS
jgi:hypothetical protein